MGVFDICPEFIEDWVRFATHNRIRHLVLPKSESQNHIGVFNTCVCPEFTEGGQNNSDFNTNF